MSRIVAVLAMIAAAIGGAALLGTPAPASAQAALGDIRSTVDLRSFLLGAVASMAAIGIHRVPWGALPRALLDLLVGWRRNFQMIALAVACVGVLLLY